jgi:hypothetical protein
MSMQGPSWIALFERIPAKLQDSLALTLVTGAEILMQSVLRLESDFAIIRGRMSGSTDAGRVLILPYDQIVNLAFTKRMLVADVQAVFGDTMESAGANGEPAGALDGAGEAETDTEETAEAPSRGVPTEMKTVLNKPPPPASAAPGKTQPPPPSKSILLARLRARLAEQGK